MRHRLTLTVIALSSVLTGQMGFGSEPMVSTWTQWRGPTRDAQITPTAWPDTLEGPALEKVWSVDLGPSYSGPIVTDDRVFVTETKDEKIEVVRALDRATGKEIWATEWEGSMKVPFFARSNGDWIRATPAYDGERLYVAGMRDVLVCLDGNTGKTVWRVDFPKELGTSLPSFGFVSSPLVTDDSVFVQAGAAFLKLDKRTGKIVWRTLEDGGGMFGSAFSSPTFATIGKQRQILVQTRTKLAGVAPADGKVLWSQEIPAFRGMNILTPTAIADRLFTSSYGGKSLMFALKDGDEGLALEEVWSNKTQGYMSSPVVIDGHIYLHLRNRRFTCIHADSGEIKWTTQPYGQYWSMVANGDRILALDERGELLLIKANPNEFTLLSQHKVSDNAWAHLAVCGDHIFVRELNAMTVYRWSQAKAAPAASE